MSGSSPTEGRYPFLACLGLQSGLPCTAMDTQLSFFLISFLKKVANGFRCLLYWGQRQVAGSQGWSQGKDGVALKAVSILQMLGVKREEKSK